MHGSDIGVSKAICDYVNFARSLPPPKAPRIFLPTDCVECLCGKQMRPADMPRKSTGLVAYTDTVCHGCVRTYRDLNTLVCARCKSVVAKIRPAVDPQDKFEFTRGGHCHVPYCGACVTDTESAEISERILWRAKNGLPNPILSSNT